MKIDTPPSHDAPSFQGKGGWWVVGQFLLMAGVVLGGWMNGGQWRASGGVFVGWGMLAAAGSVGLLGAIQLGMGLTPYPRPRAGSRMVRGGPYAWVRHPLYTSVMLAGIGWGLVCASPAALAAAAGLAVFLDAKASREERWLREHFPDYEAYARQVKRFLPGIY